VRKTSALLEKVKLIKLRKISFTLHDGSDCFRRGVGPGGEKTETGPAPYDKSGDQRTPRERLLCEAMRAKSLLPVVWKLTVNWGQTGETHSVRQLETSNPQDRTPRRWFPEVGTQRMHRGRGQVSGETEEI